MNTSLRLLRDAPIGHGAGTDLMSDDRPVSEAELTVGDSPAEHERACYFILGMHRSGTSSVAGTLVKLGAAAPAHLLGATKGNETGHWESSPLVNFHDELLASAGSRWDDWRKFDDKWFEKPVAAQFKNRALGLLAQEFGDAPLFVFKDPRNCRLSHFWFEIFAELNIRPKIIIPFRSPLEVAQSHRERDQFPLRKGMLLWLRHVLEAEANTRHLPRIIIEWNDFLSNWQSSVSSIEESFGQLPGNTEAGMASVEQFLRNDLKHQRVDEAELAKNALVHDWVQQAYAALQELARVPGSNSARTTLDQIRAQFDQSASLFGGVLADAEARVLEADAENRKALEEISRLRSEQVALRAELTNLSGQAEDVASLTGRVGELQAELDAARAALQAGLAGQADNAARSAEERNELHSRIGGLQAEMDAVRATLQAERDALAEQSANMVRLEQERTKLQARVGDVQKELDLTRTSLEAERGSLAQSQAEAGREREALVGETQRLDEALAIAAQRSDALENERNAKAKQAAELSAGLIQMRSEKTAADASHEAERARLQATLDEIQASTIWRLTGPLRRAGGLFRRTK